MAVLEYRTQPTPVERRWFGLMILVFLCLIGTLFWFRGHPGVGRNLALVGGAIAALYYVVPPLQTRIFALWMTLAYPIGWTVSHILLGIVFYLVVTPIGLVLRLAGRDPMTRRLDKNASTYWVPHRQQPVSRYFKQF